MFLTTLNNVMPLPLECVDGSRAVFKDERCSAAAHSYDKTRKKSERDDITTCKQQPQKKRLTRVTEQGIGAAGHLENVKRE